MRGLSLLKKGSWEQCVCEISADLEHFEIWGGTPPPGGVLTTFLKRGSRELCVCEISADLEHFEILGGTPPPGGGGD